ncbi:MAG: hypothetical protein JNM94_04695 [Phycisphaerae bacterium]|nr:hypothetical protein [Phycisphaerae bacterium]
MALRRTIAIEVTDTSVRAVDMRFGRGAPEVIRAVCVAKPDDVNADDPDGLGSWVGSALRAAGFPSSGEVIAVIERESCTLRTMELPADDEFELPDVARLAAIRETPSEAGALVVDVIGRGMHNGNMVALVATASDRAVNRIRQVVTAAGFRPSQITPRTFGIVTLARQAEKNGAVTIAIDAPGDGVETLVIRNGEIAHSRGVRLDPDAEASAVASEAKRSLSTWQLGATDDTIAAALFFGPESIRAVVADTVGRALGITLRPFEPDERIAVASDVDGVALASSWPLVGLVLESAAGEETINFASPRRAPDVAALRRTRFLAVLGLLCVAALLGWTVGHKSWTSLESDAEAADEEARALLPRHNAYKRAEARFAHISTWQQAAPEWLEHLQFLHGFAADPTKVVLERWTGTLDASDVQCDRDGKWKVEREVKVVLQGEAKERSIADALRDALVDDARYSLTSTGADTEGGRRFRSPFSYVLRSDEVRSPTLRERKPAASAKPNDKGGAK